MNQPTVLFEDSELIVVDKPSGMIVYSDGKHDYPSLDDWLKDRYQEPARPAGGFYFVHRLDRETSGVLVLARTEATHQFLKEQFQEREVRKMYRAFVHGVIHDERGIIDKPIGSARGGRGPRTTKNAHGTLREAITAYKVLERGADASYVEVFPKTGRTHQIRVHFASIQHPVVCDQLYAPSRPKLFGFERLALHALSLSFKHPSGHDVTFTAPLPEEFEKAEQLIKQG